MSTRSSEAVAQGRLDGARTAARRALQLGSPLRFGTSDYVALPEVALPEGDRADPAWAAIGMAPVGRLELAGHGYLLFSPGPVQTSAREAAGALGISEVLTRRELQVALLIAEGRCDKEIARALGISGYTVREHVRRIGHKLHVSRRGALVACVLGSGTWTGPDVEPPQPAPRAQADRG